MSILRWLKGNITLHYYPYLPWVSARFVKYWSGRLVYLSVSRVGLQLDCRENWIDDMKTGKVK